ncbi:MAG: glutamate-5-semialdehyde dehydrogenase [Lacibacter sp.]
MSAIQNKLAQTKAASAALQTLSTTALKQLIRSFAENLSASAPAILRANKKDLQKMDPVSPLYDRLLLTPQRLKAICNSIQKVANLPDPTGKVLLKKTLPNGIRLQKITVPLGVIGAIFESRPNVAADIAALSLKSRNACVLKGSKDAHETNRALVQVLHRVLQQAGLSQNLVYLLPPERETVQELFTATRYIDVLIPRGSNNLIEYVRKNSLVPVIETGAGVCHVYVHADADIKMAADIVVNAKTSRPSVCNAMDTLLVDAAIANKFLPQVAAALAKHEVKIFADASSYKLLKDYPWLQKARKEDFDREFLSLACAIKIVNTIEAALSHIATHGTRHSEAIVTKNKKAARLFLQKVDAAAVYHNASTRFTDGEEFGLGAEVGISTQKLHARGPFALEKLVTEKWVLRGNGQIR